MDSFVLTGNITTEKQQLIFLEAAFWNLQKIKSNLNL